jgi:hypothetical protein
MPSHGRGKRRWGSSGDWTGPAGSGGRGRRWGSDALATALPQPCKAPPTLTRPLSSHNERFLLDFACIAVYRTARIQGRTLVVMMRAC